MANEFIIRKGYKSFSDSQITGSLSVTNAVTASFFTGSFRGDGSQLTGIDGFPFTGSASISGSLTVVGPVNAITFTGDGSQLTGIEGFPYTGSAEITGSLEVTGSISTDTDATINNLTVGKGGGNQETNTVLGYEALILNVEGEGTVAIGYKALSSSLASMGPNTAVGNQALRNNIYGFRNTAIGSGALFSNTGGGFNTAVGNTALVSNIEGNENIAIGDGTLNDNTAGDNNTGVGTFAIHSNTSGSNNTAIGHSSLYNNLTGSNNTVIGTDAGYYAGSGFTSLESIDNSILIGYQARALNATGDTNEIVIGHNIVGLGSNTTVIGNNTTVSTTLKGAVSASLFSGSFVGDGSQLTGIEGFPFTGSAGITGSLVVVGSVNATSFIGSLQGTATTASYIQLANVDGFTAYSSSVNTAIGNVLNATTPLTATVNTTNTPFTLTSQSIVVADSTNGNLTVRLPDLNTIVGTPNQKPIVVYKNDYSQNVIFVNPSGSQLINGASQDLIVSIQLAVIYNPTSAGWVTEGTSAQSLAELELFFLPLTETGSLATTGSNTFIGNQTITGSLTVTGGINATITGSATSASYVEYANVANKPTLVSGSSQVSYTGLSDIPSGIVSSSTQITGYNIFATTGSNQFNGSQAITGSLTVTGQVVAQTLNVQQVTSSIVFSSGSNIFGNSLSNTQQFTGSLQVSGSNHYVTGYTSFYSNNNTAGNANGIRIEQAGTGDSVISFLLSGAREWLVGIDNSDSDTFKINNNTGGSDFNNLGLAITTSGNVGIGTNSPSSRLNIAGAKTNSADLTNAANQLAITDTTATAVGVGGRISFLGSYTATPDYITFGAIEVLKDNANNYGSASWNNAAMRFIVGNNDNDANAGRMLERMRITSDGNIRLTSNNASNASFDLNYRFSTPDSARIRFSTTTSFNLNEPGELSFWTRANDAQGGGTITERMRITSGGNVGIGTDSPGSKLEISGGDVKINNTTTTALRLNPSSNSFQASIYLEEAGVVKWEFGKASSTPNFYVYGGSTPGDAFEIKYATRLLRLGAYGAGTLTTDASGNVTATSDERLKDISKLYTSGLSALKGIKPITYKWKKETGLDIINEYTGFSAQNIQANIPEAVGYMANGDLTVQDRPIMATIINAINELNDKIEDQQFQIESLKAEIQTLKQ